MRRRGIGSFLGRILVLAVIVIIIAISLDLFGIISLPKKISLKTYLSNTVEVMGLAEEKQIYYPDYEATGVQNLIVENKQDRDVPVVEQPGEPNISLSDIIQNQDGNNQNASTNVITNNITDNSFYYNQLDTYGKTIYSRLYANLDNLKNGDYIVDFGITFNDLLQNPNGEITLTNAFQLSINALLLDHPEIFYLDVTKMYMFTESTTSIMGTTYKISIGPDAGVSYLSEGFNSRSDIIIAEDTINTIIYKLKSEIKGDTFEQVRQVHNYLIDSITYDSNSNSELSHGIYGALINKLAVCDGYTKAFKLILDNLGISCIEVCGMAQNSSGTTESHAWNDVLINGQWYAIDVTWDDPIIIGGRGILTDDLRYNYFLRGSDTFYSSHQEDGYIVSNGEFQYPVISQISY